MPRNQKPLLGLCGALLFLPLVLVTGCEREGSVLIQDCPETVELAPSDWQRYTRLFICTRYKTNSGKVMGGVCRSRDTSLFTGKCERVYVYEVPSQVTCWGAHDRPTIDDQCQCDDDYIRNATTHKCELPATPTPIDLDAMRERQEDARHLLATLKAVTPTPKK